ncbi:hypothetical protein SESBI_28270 [Sesbania bispinosa]|nr:hypothetical protein SESBI_28270 [Sesbania bispinosa]
MKNTVVEKFSDFYEKWIWKVEEILHQLLEVSKQRKEVVKTEQELQALVSKATSHIKEYYTVKWGAAHEDVLVFFSPTWVTPLENAYMWMTGWKPSLVFRLLKKGPTMTEEQQKKVEELRKRIRMEEDKVERDMERQQVAMADPKIVDLAKQSGRSMKLVGEGDAAATGVDGLVDVALKGVFAGLERVMKASDCVRLKALKGVLDVLGPMQSVEFLVAFIAMQLRLRQWGKKRDMAAASMLNQDK